MHALTHAHTDIHTHTHTLHNLAQRNNSTAVKYRRVSGEGLLWHAHSQMAVWQEHTTVHTHTRSWQVHPDP